MPMKVKKLGLKRPKGRLLFVDGAGDVSSVKMSRDGRTKATFKRMKVKKAGIKRKKGYLYYVDKAGDISRSKMKRR